MFKRVAIIGVGEIGGSVGKALKKKRLAREVIGVGRRISSLSKAKRVRAVDKTYLVKHIKEATEGADLIILATPVLKIVELGKAAALHAKEGALVTDVGSTKKYIVGKLEKIKNIRFVGSHPMAGSEKGGPLSASEKLFKCRNCFVTKTDNTDRKALAKIKTLWRRLGARPIEISPREHDKIVAEISHLAHIVASSLVLASRQSSGYAASGFRDATRIALSSPVLWKDICITNNKEIARAISKQVTLLKEFQRAIKHKKSSRIIALLKKAKKTRESLNNL